MTHRTGLKETVAFGSGLHGHSFLWLQSPTINASHPQTNSLCMFLSPLLILEERDSVKRTLVVSWTLDISCGRASSLSSCSLFPQRVSSHYQF